MSDINGMLDRLNGIGVRPAGWTAETDARHKAERAELAAAYIRRNDREPDEILAMLGLADDDETEAEERARVRRQRRKLWRAK